MVSCVDAAETFKLHACSMSIPNGLLMPTSLRLLPLFVLACLRSSGFRNGVGSDERSFAFADFKSLPLQQLLLFMYPDLYRSVKFKIIGYLLFLYYIPFIHVLKLTNIF